METCIQLGREEFGVEGAQLLSFVADMSIELEKAKQEKEKRRVLEEEKERRREEDEEEREERRRREDEEREARQLQQRDIRKLQALAELQRQRVEAEEAQRQHDLERKRLELGKGVGKGGAKRQGKIIRDNIRGIAKPAIRRWYTRGITAETSRAHAVWAGLKQREEPGSTQVKITYKDELYL